MSRRRYSSRSLRLESLEARCNPAALVPMAEFIAEPAPEDQGNLQIADLTSVAIDPFNGDRIVQAKPVDQRPLPKVDAYSMVLDRRPSLAEDKPVSLNSFAGQTVWIPIEAADAGTASQAIVGHGSDRLLGGAGQHATGLGTATGKLYVATNVGVFVGGAGRDVLLGGAGQDTIKRTGGTHELGHTLDYQGGFPGGVGAAANGARVTKIVIDDSDPVILYSLPAGGAGLDVLIANTGGDRLDTTLDTQGRLLIGTDGGIWRGATEDELSLLSKSQNSESHPSFNGGDYFTGTVTVSGD